MGHTASFRKLEVFQNCRIKSERAYSSVYDNNARWPDYNFSAVVEHSLRNPGRDSADILLMSAPTVDISNMNTSQLQPGDQTDAFQKRTVLSSQNMFNIAEKALKNHSSLSKVIIMEHPPRFDNPDVDPTSLKSNLARLANATLGGLWLNSPLKDRIVIGHHSLESSGSGSSHFDRYQHKNGKYDGVHFWGQNGGLDFTNSVKTILSLAVPRHHPSYVQAECGTAQSGNHDNNPQAKNLGRKYQPTVQTSNRFSPLNQGNC